MPESDTPPLVELRDVTKSYAEGDTAREVLSGVRLTLRRGEFVVLLGRSGSGKSTLLNLISGIDLPTRGEVLVDGRNLGTMSERERTLLRREHVGFIFQAFNLLPTLTVEENVRLPVELNGHDAAQASAKARALLERVGLTSRANSFPDRLSGGEQQRVAVARALAHSPPLLLADEPTGNLDEATGRQVLDLLEGLTRQGHACAFVVTHEPGLVARADRVLEMTGGRLVERDVPRREPR
ncbi:ABC transporter ATP-binding protein [Myxococcus llanfairpwllgwyngyllgogerychwyrndrobwllllantysiliogogogochensis]|uniref:ABC transporter ATP-binding protein n=1 Tax=Myxococcus llanfairpwllgwyngyllgogerychwyrndrobwllllantysiliogogogochensis TaxID=2590453 RepID=A0A540X6Z0_9BACT|nr:ABC transporter ATP-binding protein [Myxococcus llanfairpwllgwyngyllgogerychwyrndrobwllllantysiliogogogochensis]TQF16972.1 ABC transporter ATP-binding protein [Myxococcus llanfairpwllgwyngyllgogerychwyrndrobwllllantysiliogogogochensis]